ncbi:hypothetical protein HQ524_04860 [Candidatus Uhrbacteria bacterium]|nr:hypothetical protein [Candidatus Uhrbacteria bacterium]
MMTMIQKLLRILAVRTMRAYKPKVIGITGSVGKTSTRHAIAAAIGDARSIRVAEGNYNNEMGLPLTILGEQAQGSSIFGWMGVLWRGFVLSLGAKDDYPKWLVLEYGADKKGDIVYLTNIARPYIAVITAIGIAHTEFFGTIDDVKEEKGALVRALPEDGIAILNADDENVFAMRHMVKGAHVMYGFSTSANVSANNVTVDTKHDGDIDPTEVVAKLRFELSAGDDSVMVSMDNVLGDAHVSAILAGAAVALQLGIELDVIAKNLKSYVPMPGRMRLLGGIKHSLLLDDSYNASPQSVHAALEALGSFPLTGTARRIAIVGDMLELGRYSEKAHIEVGQHVASLPIDLLVTVGELSRDIARGALAAGMDQANVFTYAASPDAGRFVQKRMGKGDVILVKGSQSIRTEKIVKELMAEPLKAQEYLVRQNEEWLKK